MPRIRLQKKGVTTYGSKKGVSVGRRLSKQTPSAQERDIGRERLVQNVSELGAPEIEPGLYYSPAEAEQQVIEQRAASERMSKKVLRELTGERDKILDKSFKKIASW